MKPLKYYMAAITVTLVLVAFNFTALGWIRSIPLAVGKVTGDICRWGGCTGEATVTIDYAPGRTVSYCPEHAGSAPDSISTKLLDGIPILTVAVMLVGLLGYYYGLREFLTEPHIPGESVRGSIIVLIVVGLCASLAPWITVLF